MAKGLFATENDDLNTGVAEDLDVTPEVGAVGEVEAETTADVAGVTDDADAIDDGAIAGEQLEEVQDVLTEAVDSGEGLSPVAAESIRMTIAAICKPIHADPKRVYSLYARESFAAESSRLANTKFALEGVKEFLTDLYKRIKAALERLWTKVKAFWDKHISAVGRMKKAIESMKKKVKATGNKLKGSPVVESIPSSLARAFDAEGELKSADVSKVIAAAMGFVGGSAVSTKYLAAVAKGEAPAPGTDEDKIAGFVNGVTLVFSYQVDDDGKIEKIEVEREDSEKEADGSKGLVVAKKETLTEILTEAGKSIDAVIAARKAYDKNTDVLNKALQTLATEIQGQADQETKEAKDKRVLLANLAKLGSFNAKAATMAASENVKACKAALSYVAFNLKYYTK